MSVSYKPHRPTAKRLLNQIGSRYALSNMVLLFFLLPAYGTGLIFEGIRLETTFLERFAVATAGYLATILILIAARTTWPGESDKSRPGFVLATFLVAGAFRGVTILIAELITGQHQAGEEF
ncbi:MAG: hypothetical protein WAO31_06705, partial [Rhodoluna sp.]